MTIVLSPLPRGNRYQTVDDERQRVNAAREAAGKIIDNPKPYRVSHRHPCPVCGRKKYCCHDEQNGITLCSNESRGAILDANFRPVQVGQYGFLHVRDLSRLSITSAPPRERKPIDRTPPPEITRFLAKLSANRQPGLLDILAGKVGLPGRSLAAIGCEAEGVRLYTPERDAAGRVIGYQERTAGGKYNQGHRGLTYTGDWRQRAIAAGFLLLVEGGSDTAACEAMGLPSIGRPSNTGGVDLLAELLDALPAAVNILVVGERDEKAGGKWPGRDGAVSTAESLSKRLGRPVEAVFPPDDAKDTRAWFTAQQPALDDEAGLLGMGRRFVAGLVPVDGKIGSPCSSSAGALQCPDSHVLPNGTVRSNRDNATDSPGNCNPPANRWKLPPRIWEKYDSNAWDCPEAFGAAGLSDLSPALICATCRKRYCPVCGAYWRLQTYDRFGCHLSSYDGQLYTDVVPDYEWGTILKDMRRRAKKLGMPLRFVSLRCKEGDELTVIASVPIRSDVAHPAKLSEALGVLERALDDADFGPRPITACRAWGPLEREKKAERVPGGCSPTAFRATVKSWGAAVSAKQEQRQIIRPDKIGMFKGETGQLDEQAQADFWFEGWLRSGGTAEADQGHPARCSVRCPTGRTVYGMLPRRSENGNRPRWTPAASLRQVR